MDEHETNQLRSKLAAMEARFAWVEANDAWISVYPNGTSEPKWEVSGLRGPEYGATLEEAIDNAMKADAMDVTDTVR